MNSLQIRALDWFKTNQRDLPWRKTDPWGVLVSEIMLQQTPVKRVLPVYEEWMKRWPTPSDLASATKSEVIVAWGRLGYPRRALRLHQCAQVISENHGGEVPNTVIELRSLPGIGEYTAAAIVAFAFHQPSLVLDVNIRRFFCRVIDGIEIPKPSITKAERLDRAALIPTSEANVWAAATMELGALICTSQKPQCHICPVADLCRWKSLGFPESLMVKKVQAWHGTDRQCRGVIVQALRESKSLSTEDISKLWQVPSQIEKAIETLLKDGLIAEHGKSRYSLPT